MSNDTCTWGTPRGAGGMPESRKRPRLLLPSAICRSPCNTCTSTELWLGSEVLNTSLLRTGIGVLRGISTFMTPPMVSSPNDNGVTSLSIRSRNSPVRIPACTAAPIATTSSGFTDWQGSRGTKVRTICCTIGMRVDPPTSTTSSMSSAASPESRRARCTGRNRRSSRSGHSPSNTLRSSVVSMCSGPSGPVAMNGNEMGVLCTPLSSILAFSAASVSRCRACRSRRRSTLCSA